MVSEESLILISGGAAIVGALIGSITGGFVNYYLQKTDKRMNFNFERKKKIYLKIDHYLEKQSMTSSLIIGQAISGKHPSQKNIEEILYKMLKNLQNIEAIFYSGIDSWIINNKILKEFREYKEIIIIMKDKEINLKKLYLRTNMHVNKTRDIIRKELGL
tara:strand:+ start:7981 stop:8460 length:480 start_codon:yes stop_codon:yes gene_type:complete